MGESTQGREIRTRDLLRSHCLKKKVLGKIPRPWITVVLRKSFLARKSGGVAKRRTINGGWGDYQHKKKDMKR